MSHSPVAQAAERATRSPRAPAGELRLLATLEALILALLAAFLGRRRTAAHWHALSPLDYVTDDEDLPYACFYPCTALPVAPRDYRLPCHTHQGIEHPILYVLGPGPNRGMRPLPRRDSAAKAAAARAPPPGQAPPRVPPLPTPPIPRVQPAGAATAPQGSPTHALFVPIS